MREILLIYRLLRFGIGGVAAIVLGVSLILAGDSQSIITGCGTILVGVVVFGFLIWASASAKRASVPVDSAQPDNAASPVRLIWLGIGLAMVPGLLYFYMRATMSRFDPGAVIFLSVPLLISAIGCTVIGLWSLAGAARMPASSEDVATTEGVPAEQGAAAGRPRD